jgi:5-methylcytosine-specific restriction enzyme subunit McrC
LKRKSIYLQEYDSEDADLNEEEYDILSKHFKDFVDIIELGNGKYRIKSKQYIGNIIIPSHIIHIEPKIEKLNFPSMLYYAEEPFKQQDFKYLKQYTILELIIKNLVNRVEQLCRRGISKSYYNNEENLSYIKGNVLNKENLAHNLVFKHHVYCRYSEFDSDSLENRIIKYTLYRLSIMDIEREDLRRRVRFLLHYFESISLIPSVLNSIPEIVYNRLTAHYEPIIRLCKLILAKSSFNLRSSGELKFFSFLVDMNELFEGFIAGILRTRLSKEGFIIKGGKKKEDGYADTQSLTKIKPDIVIWYGNKQRLLVIDAKYKDKVTDDDLNQIWIYTIILKLPNGILVYPHHALFKSQERTLREVNQVAIIKSIDLNKQTSTEFKCECDRFVNDIGVLLHKAMENSGANH